MPQERGGRDRRSDDAALLAELAKAWRIPLEPDLCVVGRLRARLRVRRPDEPRSGGAGGPATVTFLEDLVHPDTGQPLSYPPPSTRGATAFVPDTEARRVDALPRGSGDGSWMMAALDPSPALERDKHANRYLCMVRPGSLRPLAEVPDEWNLRVTGVTSARLVAEGAREAIEARLAEDTGRSRASLEATRRALADTERERAATIRAAEEAQARLDASERQLAAVEAEIERSRADMDDQRRRLASLVRERGQRLLALDLIDEDQLRALGADEAPPDNRPGASLADALGGDFGRVAGFVQAFARRRDMLYGQAQLRDVLACLRTHDLVVLAGDPGAGKSSLVRQLAAAIGARCAVVPVKPNWTGPEDLLGYQNPIEGRYHSTSFLEALLAAAREPDVPFLLCLDEMNLARVEHYLADFLSLLEDRRAPPPIRLQAEDGQRDAVVDQRLFLALEAEARRLAGLPDNATLADILLDRGANDALHRLIGLAGADTVLTQHARLRRALGSAAAVPPSLPFPTNLRLIGTINVDDTTHALSPKILDRAHVLRVPNPVLADWAALDAEAAAWEADGGPDGAEPLRLEAADLGERGEYPPLDRANAEVARLLALARDRLEPLGVEFGLRAVRQGAHYLRQAAVAGIGPLAAMNNVALHKMLPKLALDLEGANGPARREGLRALRDDLAEMLDGLDPAEVPEDAVAALDRMIAAADANNGVVSYWTRA